MLYSLTDMGVLGSKFAIQIIQWSLKIQSHFKGVAIVVADSLLQVGHFTDPCQSANTVIYPL